MTGASKVCSLRHISMRQLLLLLPAVILLTTIYPIGINTNVSSNNLTAPEMDAPGPCLQLNDISEGFSRSQPRRHVAIFHSMVTSIAYVPYIWVRGGGLPPYNLEKLSHSIPSISEELIVISRAMNVLAALGVVALSFLIFLRFCNSEWGAAFVALSIALNANLMFQSSVTFMEPFSIFWTILSLYFFVLLWTSKENSVFWLSGFMVFAAFAASTHERMIGYFVISAPAAIFKYCQINHGIRNKRHIILGCCTAVFIGVIAFCLANNVFGAGIAPTREYLRFKSGGTASADRFSSVGKLISNQVRCHTHAVIIIMCTLTISPLLSVFGVWKLWKSRQSLPFVLLLFPLGYEMFSVGIPGWTAGRYILGQMIFVSIFAGFGAAYLMGLGKDTTTRLMPNRKTIRIALLVVALLAQGSIVAAVKILDYYYNPHRVIEIVAKNNPGKKIGVQSFSSGPSLFSEDEFWAPSTLTGLICRIQADNYELPIKISDIKSLNDVLKAPDFYDRVVGKKRNMHFTPDLKDMVDKTKDVRGKSFSSLLANDQWNIEGLNRLVLEEIYPLETPKSLVPFSVDWSKSHNVEVIIIPHDQKKCNNVDILITKFRDGCRCENIRKEEFRKPPYWMLRLVSRERAQLYLCEEPSAINIQYCNK